MLKNIKIPDTNLLLIFGAVAGVIFIGYSVKKAAGAVGDYWDGLDLNPFDSQGTIGKPAISALDTIKNAFKTPYKITEADARQALSKLGLDFTKYYRWVSPSLNTKPPAGSYKVTKNGSWVYYAPKTKKSPLSVFSL